MIPEWFNLGNTETKDKYTYEYGIKDIGLYYNEYSESSVFVSKKYNVSENILGVSIRAEDSSPNSSIEYYISFDNEWIPIIPNNKDYIENELLIILNGSARLRFIPSETISIFENGIELIQGKDYKINQEIVSLPIVNKNSIYSATYYPQNIDQYKLISVPSKNKKISDVTEVFTDGTDAFGKITLKNAPYVDEDNLLSNVPIKVYLESNYENDSYFKGYPSDEVMYSAITPFGPILKGEDINVAISSFGKNSDSLVPATRNITDYTSHKEVQLRLYDNNLSYLVVDPNNSQEMVYPFFEYIHSGNNLYFANKFNYVSDGSKIVPSARITVSYQTLNIGCRVKIILRNTSGQITETPSVDQYALIFKVKG